jgi:hypothetical protein
MMKKGYARGGMKKKMMMAGGASMKKKMMAAGGNMKKKAYAAGGASGMKKKMMQAGGATTGLKPIPAGNKGLAKLDKDVRNNMGYMSKGGQPPLVLPPVLRKAIADKKVKIDSKGNVVMTDAARRKASIQSDAMNKAMKGQREKTMKKKSYATGGGATSDYDITQRKYGGAGKKRTGTTTTAKKPVVTKAMMDKAGVTSLRDFYNKMEVNAAGTGYKKRSKALTRTGAGSRTSKMNQANPKLNFGTKKPSKSQTTTMKPSKPKKKAGPLGFQKFFEALSKRGGFRSD